MEEQIRQMLEQLAGQNRVLELIQQGLQRGIIKDHLKTDDACYYLSCSPNTLTKICRRNKILPERIGGENYYCVDQLRSIFNR